MKDFPQELVDRIIDDVAASKNTKDLSICGGVCKRWLHRSRGHLFSHITVSNRGYAAIQKFIDLVDGSLVPILALVRSLDMHFSRGCYDDAHEVRLQSCEALVKLCIHVNGRYGYEGFGLWLERNIPRFGTACSALAHLELVNLGCNLPLHVLATVVSSLPALTHLRIHGGDMNSEAIYGVFLAPETVLPTAVFPRHLDSLDVALCRGKDLFFEWLLSYDQPPVFTSIRLGGISNGARIEPLDAYFQRFGSKIESLSLAYWIFSNGLYSNRSSIRPFPLSQFMHPDFCLVPATYDFEERVISCATNLVHLSRIKQHSVKVPGSLTRISSRCLATMSIEMDSWQGSVRADWPAIDEALAGPQFAALQRVEFTDQITQCSCVTPHVKKLMPRASARGILD
ncbi:hypothetical protein C8R43DRAFT_1128106 [Mycena crocata]|nr:hypothetical protein C8R43DRAFT_1128106 [Mycena crocata]